MLLLLFVDLLRFSIIIVAVVAASVVVVNIINTQIEFFSLPASIQSAYSNEKKKPTV